MLSRALKGFVLAGAMIIASNGVDSAQADQHAYGTAWGGANSYRDWDRMYHYPYVYYPQNFYSQEYYKSSDSMYYRYAPEMRIPFTIRSGTTTTRPIADTTTATTLCWTCFNRHSFGSSSGVTFGFRFMA